MDKEYDFERASLLLHIVVEAGKHGPLYQKLMAAAQAELKDMLTEEEKPVPQVRPAATIRREV